MLHLTCTKFRPPPPLGQFPVLFQTSSCEKGIKDSTRNYTLLLQHDILGMPAFLFIDVQRTWGHVTVCVAWLLGVQRTTPQIATVVCRGCRNGFVFTQPSVCSLAALLRTTFEVASSPSCSSQVSSAPKVRPVGLTSLPVAIRGVFSKEGQ